MNQLPDDNIQKVKCSQNSTSTKNKNKNAKDPPETNNEVSINSEELCESLVNVLQINKVSNLTNGTRFHLSDIVQKSDAPVAVPSESAANVNSVQCNDDVGEPDRCDNDMHGDSRVRHISNECAESSEHDDKQQSIENELSDKEDDISIVSYESELQMSEIMRLIQKDLSEPYSIYTYRYFIHNWPKLCFLATDRGRCIGAIVCKLDMHRNTVKRGYIAMLAVDEKYRKRKIGSRLVQQAIEVMIADNAAEVVLETEITNKPALKLYENLGFVRDKRLFRYYLNGVDALRLKLWLR